MQESIYTELLSEVAKRLGNPKTVVNQLDETVANWNDVLNVLKTNIEV